MLHIDFDDSGAVYYVFTNVGNNLILVTRDGMFATIVNAALKNEDDDSEFRITTRKDGRKKAAR